MYQLLAGPPPGTAAGRYMKSTMTAKNRDRALDSVFGQMDCFRLPTKGTTFQPLAPPAGLAAARHQCIQNGTHKIAKSMKNLNFYMIGYKVI